VEPACVGIILDSSIIIAAEHRGHTVRKILEQVKAVQGEMLAAMRKGPKDCPIAEREFVAGTFYDERPRRVR
jgi:hypothetical protein